MRPFFYFIFLLFAHTAFSQNPSDTLPFPSQWAGTWSGTLNIYSAQGILHSIPMSLEVNRIDTSSTGRYAWGMMYVSKEKDWRPYELVPIDATKGLWKIDEKNSIVMESYLLGPKFLCWFTVESSRILCTYEKTGPNTIVFEVMAGKEAPVSTTGNTKQGSEDISEVKTYPFGAFQRAVLSRVD